MDVASWSMIRIKKLVGVYDVRSNEVYVVKIRMSVNIYLKIDIISIFKKHFHLAFPPGSDYRIRLRVDSRMN